MRTKLKRLLAGFLAAVITASVLPIQALAATWGEGDKVFSAMLGDYIGYDGQMYRDQRSYPYIRYTGVGQTAEGYRVASSHAKLSVSKNGNAQQVICIEAGVDLDVNIGYEGVASDDSEYLTYLPDYVLEGIELTLLCGFNSDTTSSPVANTNLDDFSFATQMIVWEYQQQLRTTPVKTALTANSVGTPAKVFYEQLEGRPAELCYDWILNKMASYAKIPSFTKSNQSQAQTAKMVYNTTTKNYSVTLTDTTNSGMPANAFNISGVTVTKSGNQYTFTTTSKITGTKLASYTSRTDCSKNPLVVWRVQNTSLGYQTMAAGLADPVQFYLKLATEDRADASVQKTFDNDSELTAAEKKELYSQISFTIKDKSSGNYIKATGSAGSYTYSGTSTSATYYKPDTTGKFVVKNMPIDTYTLTEYSSAPDYTPAVKSKDFTTKVGQTVAASYQNNRDTGILKIEKKWISDETLNSSTISSLNNNIYFTIKDVASGKYVTVKYNTYYDDPNDPFSASHSQWDYTGLVDSEADATKIKIVATSLVQLPVGNYTVKEHVAAGSSAADYKITANNLSATVKKDETVTRTFTNKKAPVLVIRKKFSDEVNLTEDELKAEYEKISIRVKCIGPSSPPAGYYMTATGSDGEYTYNNLVASGGTLMKLDENGEIHLSFGSMQGLTFQVEEYYSGTDYTTDEPKTFALISGSVNELIELPDIEFVNELKTGKVEITKEFLNVDGDSETVTNEQLADISFVIRNEDGKLLNFSGSNGVYSYTGTGIGTQLKLSDTYKLTADSLPSKKQYTIEEVSGTDGYSFTVDPVTFEITPAGIAQKVFYNKAQTGYLTIKKNSADGKLSGWKFRVELVSSPFKSYTYNKTFTTDANGVISIGDLRVGTYKVTEITSGVVGYITPESQTVTIEADELSNVTMTNTPYAHIRIEKVNSKTDEIVSGAAFAIFEADGTTPAKAYKSATDKTLINAVITESPAGSGIYVCNYLPITSANGTKYVIKETSAPDGYFLDNGSYTVTLDAANEVVPVSNNGTTQFVEDEYGHGQIAKEWTAPVNPTSTEIKELEKNVYFTVKDAVTKEYLKVSGSNGSYTYAGTVGTSVTDSAKFTLANSKFVISKLPTGKYTITEYNNAPGYSPATQSATLTVQRNQTGTVSFVNKRDTGTGGVEKLWSTPDTLTSAEITELEKNVYFTVKDAVTKEYLKVSGSNGSYTYVGTIGTSVTDTAKFMLVNGKFAISNMPTGKYTITEYNNASGYSPKTQSATLTIVKDTTSTIEFTNERDTGTAQIEKEWTAPVNPTSAEIAELEKSVYFTVTDANGNYLMVSGSNGAYTYIGTQIMKTQFVLVNGKFEISNMPTGVYTVTEYNNAPGYSPATQSVTIEVKKNETATASFTNDRDTGTAQIVKKWIAPVALTPAEVTELEKSVYFTITDANGNYLMVSGSNGAYTYIGTQIMETQFVLVNGKFEISNMPTGVYTVTEYNNAPGYSPATQSVTIEVKKNETATASFTNDRDTGTAQIVKKWTAPVNPTSAEITELEKSVYFTVTDVDGNYLKVSGNNGTYTYIGTQSAEAKFMLVNGKFEISDMPTGKYKVTEYNNAPGYSPATQSVTIEVKKNETATASFTNDRDTGTAHIEKEWTAPVNPTAEEITELEKSVYFTVTDVDGNYLKVSGNNGTYTYIGTQTAEAKFMLVNGKFEISDMPTGKYKVTEYNNAPGYSPKTQSVTIEVKKDETAKAEFTNDRDTGTAQIEKEWTAPDLLEISDKVELEKDIYFTVVNKDGNYLKVSGENGSYTYIGVQEEETKFMLLGGRFKISNMPTGEYKVTEYNNAPGYSPATQSVTIEVKKDETATASFINDRDTGDGEIIKTWVSATELTAEEKAELESKVFFTITDADGNYLKVSDVINDKYIYIGVQAEEVFFKLNNSKIAITNLPTGKYVITEINEAEGYLPKTQSVEIEVKKDETSIANFINEIILGNITLNKVDAENKDVYLPGAVYMVYLDVNKNGTYEAEIDTEYKTLTDNNGVYSLLDIPYGQYLVKEIEAPEGYLIDENYYPVFIDTPEENENVSNTNENDVFTEESIKGNVKITKVDEDYPDVKLTGAEFTIFALDKETVIGVMTEVEEGVYVYEGLRYGAYYVQETKAPEYFIRDVNFYYFEIVNNGETVTVSNDEIGKGTFINSPQKGEIKIIKTSYDNEVEGIKFKVTGTEFVGNKPYEQTFVTDENGEIHITGLRPGNYVVSEIESEELLEKYILADDVQLTINKNGQKAVVPMFNGQRSSSNPETGVQLDGTNNPTMPILFVSVALSILSGTIILIAPFKKCRNNK